MCPDFAKKGLDDKIYAKNNRYDELALGYQS